MIEGLYITIPQHSPAQAEQQFSSVRDNNSVDLDLDWF